MSELRQSWLTIHTAGKETRPLAQAQGSQRTQIGRSRHGNSPGRFNKCIPVEISRISQKHAHSPQCDRVEVNRHHRRVTLSHLGTSETSKSLQVQCCDVTKANPTSNVVGNCTKDNLAAICVFTMMGLSSASKSPHRSHNRALQWARSDLPRICNTSSRLREHFSACKIHHRVRTF